MSYSGTMPPGEGSRFVGVAEDYLQRKTARLEERMRSLEDALAIVQANTSSQPHPLLVKKFPLEDEENDADEETPSTNDFNKYGLIDALGSLHLDGEESSGAVRFFGPSGGSESLLLRAKEIVTETSPPSNIPQELDASYLPQEINIFYQSFPFTPSGYHTQGIQDKIETYMPSPERSTALCETFLKSLSWMFHIISRQYIFGELHPSIYNRRENPSKPRTYGPHDLALLLMLMAIGALVDPSLPAYNAEAQHYHRLARAALCLQSVFIHRSVTTIKVLHLMSVYNGMSGMESNLENSYSFLNFAGQVALQIGFHKDPSRWGIQGREAYDRRSYFWNLMAGSLWQSLVNGRPPVITPSFIDCKFPTELEETTYQIGEVPLGFGTWSFRYTLECLAPVVEVTQAAKPPAYQAVLELDRKIRDFAVPVSSDPTEFERMSREMQAFVRSHYRELTLLFLHRGFFAQAMADYPSDPLRSPLGQSFLVAYQSACVVLGSTREQFSQQPILCARVWRIWSFAFSAAVIVGTVAVRNLGVQLTPEPLEQLEHACALFTSAAETSNRAQRALPILLRLRQKAYRAHQTAFTGNASFTSPSEEPDEELAIFGGRTMLVTNSKSPPESALDPTRLARSSVERGSSQSFPIQQHPASIIPQAQAGPSQPPRYTTSEGSIGMPVEWENLYREIPGPEGPQGTHTLYGSIQRLEHPAGGAVLEDRWSCFMHDSAAPADRALPPPR
ncbi:hypothetical protein BJ138DRAFT_49320 [Hygrophoropsis aurantiaca]|uniref:Uncharacterized protein n=1 Tax=Hygrophoropsis aurantiaca TaxID=72124 RepID=A0ACB8ACI3_9AGAM|nr:hypothetical protein BJ138DRAFT_49320 [Hygrophoropsis aurantiaca]